MRAVALARAIRALSAPCTAIRRLASSRWGEGRTSQEGKRSDHMAAMLSGRFGRDCGRNSASADRVHRSSARQAGPGSRVMVPVFPHLRISSTLEISRCQAVASASGRSPGKSSVDVVQRPDHTRQWRVLKDPPFVARTSDAVRGPESLRRPSSRRSRPCRRRLRRSQRPCRRSAGRPRRPSRSPRWRSSGSRRHRTAPCG